MYHFQDIREENNHIRSHQISQGNYRDYFPFSSAGITDDFSFTSPPRPFILKIGNGKNGKANNEPQNVECRSKRSLGKGNFDIRSSVFDIRHLLLIGAEEKEG